MRPGGREVGGSEGGRERACRGRGDEEGRELMSVSFMVLRGLGDEEGRATCVRGRACPPASFKTCSRPFKNLLEICIFSWSRARACPHPPPPPH